MMSLVPGYDVCLNKSPPTSLTDYADGYGFGHQGFKVLLCLPPGLDYCDVSVL